MAVIGISARAVSCGRMDAGVRAEYEMQDCIETLEKRVKSRCQSRVHHVLPSESPFTGTAKTVEQTMIIHSEDAVSTATEEAWNAVVKVRINMS